MLYLFGFGPLLYGQSPLEDLRDNDLLTRFSSTASCLLLNAIAILSEDRFLARSTFTGSPCDLPRCHAIYSRVQTAMQSVKEYGQSLTWYSA
jgi:hypothetical protein